MAFSPSLAQAQKYQDYSVDVVQSDRAAYVAEFDGELARFIYKVVRVPSESRFVIFVFQNLTEHETRRVNSEAAGMPHGLWARDVHLWGRHRSTNGRYFFGLDRGFFLPTAAAHLERMFERASYERVPVTHARLGGS